jgi:hypothetical protein
VQVDLIPRNSSPSGFAEADLGSLKETPFKFIEQTFADLSGPAGSIQVTEKAGQGGVLRLYFRDSKNDWKEARHIGGFVREDFESFRKDDPTITAMLNEFRRRLQLGLLTSVEG